MEMSALRLQAKLMRDYYRFFSKYAKGKKPSQKVAWVTAFTPVEILEALGVLYYYPESYAAVIAASDQEQPLLEKCADLDLSRDCCSYSCCMEGCLSLEAGPRGLPPKPDILIATNNQCNTLPGWWNMMAQEMDIPLVVIDYPGEDSDRDSVSEYVTAQHKALISKLEALTGNSLDISILDELISVSMQSVASWQSVLLCMSSKDIDTTSLFDDINFLITARCKPETEQLYQMMYEEYRERPDADASKAPVYWLGYPLWYHKDRFFSEYLDGMRITGANYLTWWCLDYSGKDAFEKLFSAYNYTFLNMSQSTRNKRLKTDIEKSGAIGAVSLINKSCKCDFVSSKDIEIPMAELSIDMIDRNFADTDDVRNKIALLKDTICTE